jgi:hypothetical protein
MEMKTRLFGLLVVFVSLGFTSSVLAGSTRVTKDGIQFPDGTTQTTSSTGGYGRWSADVFNVYYNSGNVGIGTTSPQNKLHIAGNFPQLLIQSDASGNLGYEGLFLGQTESGTFSLTGWIGDTNNLSRELVVGADSTYPLILYQNGEVRMTINNGKVGIGTTNPNEVLEVAGSGRAFFGDGGGSSRKGLLIDGTQGSTGARLEAFDYGASAGLDLVINTIGHGNVGIGTSDPGQKLDIADGNGRVETGYNWLTNSDSRLKKNVSTLDGSLEKISRLRGVRFDTKEANSVEKGAGKHIGVIAQELEKEYPELVVGDEKTGYKAVAYDKLTAVLIEAVKELKTENQTQKEILEKQQAEIEELRSMIKELKS